jgi:hypothetical protein
VQEASGSDSGVSKPDFSDSDPFGKNMPGFGGKASKEPQIEFLCPNGHRLFGPESLQGRPGECPECGARFRIPTYEEMAVAQKEVKEEEIRLGQTEARTGDRVAVTTPRPSSASISAASASTKSRLVPAEVDGQTTISGQNLTGHGMAALVARLWNARPTGAIMEIRLRNGETILPDKFLKKASQQSRQGVFTVKDAGGNSAITVIAWDTVDRVTLSGLVELPQEFGE